MMSTNAKQPRISDGDKSRALKFAKQAFRKYNGSGYSLNKIFRHLKRKQGQLGGQTEQENSDRFELVRLAYIALKNPTVQIGDLERRFAPASPYAMLGTVFPKNVGSKGRFQSPSTDTEIAAFKRILSMGLQTYQIHAQACMTSQTYPGPGVLQHAHFNRGIHVLNNPADPVLFALLVNKIQYCESRMIFSNLSECVKMRSKNMFPTFMSDNQLLMDMSRTTHYMESNPKEPWASLAEKAELQIMVKNSATLFRTGQIYHQAHADLQHKLSMFCAKSYDSPWMAQFRDEGTRMRKYMELFYMRPMKVSNQPVAQGVVFPQNLPYGAQDFAEKGTVQVQIPYSNQRQGVGTPNIVPTDLFSSFKSGQIQVVQNLVSAYRLSLVYSQGLLVFYVNRRMPTPSFPNQMSNFAAPKLNSATGVELHNPHPIDKNTLMESDPEVTHGVQYVLTSVVCCTISPISLPDQQPNTVAHGLLNTVGVPANARNIVTGSCCLYVDRSKSARECTYHCYDPQQGVMNKLNAGKEINPSVVDTIDRELFLHLASTRGTVYVYSPLVQLNSSVGSMTG